MASNDLEKRIAQLEDVQAIRQLKARYCLHVDRRNEDAWVSLFTQDGVWESDKFGIHEGREAIRALFKSIPDFLNFALHYVTNPVIEVDGNRAIGNWLLLEPCTFVQGNQPAWGAGRYEEEYVKVGGEWKFKHLKLISSFWTPYTQGWVEKRFIQD
ncbi:MAG TPA: nuclear transport factor 2 family protein [Candidatus Binataceae bacterium]|nr:nuclear transport factor 2 family protein [Candidatus Binataceae bacterium]